MIYLGFLFDYLIMLFLPINTYFVVADLDKNRLLSIIFIGILLDVMYHKFFINLIILLVFFVVLRFLHIKKKYKMVKNIVVYFLYFSLMHFCFGYNQSYFVGFGVGFILQIIYIKLSKLLLK